MNTPEIESALRAKLPTNEYALLFNVGNGTGFGVNGWADAVAVSLWPSRGIEITGFEIKASRSDWLRELKNPAKGELIAKYCDRWVIVAPVDVVKIPELPLNWGLWEISDKGRWQHSKAAPQLTPVALDRTFVAAMLRRASEADAELVKVEVEKEAKALRDRSAKQLDQAVEYRMRAHKELQAAVTKFEEASGVKVEHTWNAGEIGRAVKLILERGEAGVFDDARALRDRLNALLVDTPT